MNFYYRNYFFRFLSHLSLCFLGLSCSKKFIDVKFSSFHLPVEGYQELSTLLVIMDQDAPVHLRGELQRQLSDCSPFAKIEFQQESLSFAQLKRDGISNFFKAYIAKNKLAQKSQGMLILDLAHQKIDNNLERSKAIQYNDEEQYLWFANHAFPDEFGFAKRLYLAPEQKLKSQSILIRNHIYEWKFPFVFYNRVSNQVIAQDQLLQRSMLSNFSKSPALKHQDVEKKILEGMAHSLKQQVCAGTTQVEQIYYHPKKDQAALLVNEGVDLAKENRWPLAATKWKNALLQNKNDAIAHHNMAIYLEKSGKLAEAVVHLKKAASGENQAFILKPRHQSFSKQYEQISDSDTILAQISFVSSGNWVHVQGFDQELSLDRSYSIYRIDAIRDRQLKSIGTHMREVGTIRIMERTERFWLGRIEQSTVDYPIKAGDFIIR
ncbi:MAG: hypothetical protein ACOH5I_23915 [Oligoflexus sp.]